MKNNNTDFNFCVPIDDEWIQKASKESGDKRYEKMIISGMGSDSSTDSDEEILEPDGYILDRFLKYGIVNWEHLAKKDPTAIIGEPIEAKVKNNEFYIKAKLYKDVPLARKVWDTMINLNKSESTRKIGWSIEGKSLMKDPINPKRIIKALITGISLTMMPKNTNTWADIVKGKQEKDFEDYKYDDDANGGKIYLLDVTTPKGIRITVDKDFNIKMDKAMTTDSARALIPESLDGKLVDLKGKTFRKNIQVLANYHKSIGFDNNTLKKIKKKINNYF